MKFNQFIKSDFEYFVENCMFSEEQEQVLKMSIKGKSIDQIAYAINCSPETVKKRRREIAKKINKLER